MTSLFLDEDVPEAIAVALERKRAQRHHFVKTGTYRSYCEGVIETSLHLRGKKRSKSNYILPFPLRVLVLHL